MGLLSNKAMWHGIPSVSLVALKLHLLFAEVCHSQKLGIPHVILTLLQPADETSPLLNNHGLPLRGRPRKFQKGSSFHPLALYELIYALPGIVAEAQVVIC